MGATNTLGRVSASLGRLAAVEPCFTSNLDIPNGGVLVSLPALLANGLLRHTDKYFQLPRGYYSLPQIFVILGFMALARLQFIESLRHVAPGEWGKLVGLDRVPEARTMREKIALLSDKNQPTEWSAELCRDWMNESPEESAVLYVDGHVRVYHGNQTKLPRHYISREKLCARATCDYWINAMDGKPFFLITKEVDPGLLQVLENDIVERLERDVPNQPSQEELEENPNLHRFTMIFDREGYSPEFLVKMKKKRIACQTYNKLPGEDWPLDEFALRRLKMAGGEELEVKLAERGVLVGAKTKIWVREVRKLKKDGKQVSMISTNYTDSLIDISVAMFSRWSQENFFGSSEELGDGRNGGIWRDAA